MRFYSLLSIKLQENSAVTKYLTFVVAFLTSVVAQGALLTDFASSFAQYQSQGVSVSDFDQDQSVDGHDFLSWQLGMGLTNEKDNTHGDANIDRTVDVRDLGVWLSQFAQPPKGIPDSVCFKLFFDPAGVIEGRVTVVVDAPQAGTNRFVLGSDNGLIAADSRFDVAVENETIQVVDLRERYEAQVHFTLKAGVDVPTEPVTIFGYQVRDNAPELSPAPVLNSFQFVNNDFITVRNEDQTTTTFLENQLTDANLPLNVPLVLDVNTSTGATIIRNPSGATVDITYYEILSDAGSLNPAGWVSIDDTEGGDPPGVGWEEAGTITAQAIAESNLTSSLTLASAQTRGLGTAFPSVAVPHDLRFNYGTLEGGFLAGAVNYIVGAPTSAVPEPGGIALALLGISGWAPRRRQRAEENLKCNASPNR